MKKYQFILIIAAGAIAFSFVNNKLPCPEEKNRTPVSSWPWRSEKASLAMPEQAGKAYDKKK